MINSEIKLILTCSENWVLINIITQTAKHADPNADPPVLAREWIDATTVKDSKLYVLVVTFSTENDKKLLEQLKSGFKRTIKWNKYRSQMTIQSNNNNLNYLIDLTFTKVTRVFVLLLARNTRDDHRDSFSYYYVPNVEIKDWWKKFFDNLSVKNKEELYEEIIEMSRNIDYTTGNLLDFAYFKITD